MKKITKDEFEKVIKENDKVLIDFYANWCGPCKMLAPVLEEVEEETDVLIVKVDVDEEYELAQMFNVTSIPTLIYFKDGKPSKMTRGYNSKEVILNMFN